MDPVSVIVVVVAGLGLLGGVAEVVAIVRRSGRGLGIAGIALRVAGLAALGGFIIAARGGPDFVAIGYAVLGLLVAAALWAAATVVDIVLVVRHPFWSSKAAR